MLATIAKMDPNQARNLKSLLPTSSTGEPKSLLDFLGIRDDYPMFNMIARCLDIRDIISLTRTCKQLHHLYQKLLPRFWDIDRSLRPYFNDPKRLRSLMAKYNVLLAGEFVLQFLDRVPAWPGTVFQFYIYTPEGSNANWDFQELFRSLDEISSFLADEGFTAGRGAVRTITSLLTFQCKTKSLLGIP